MNSLTVKQLKDIIAGLPDEMPVLREDNSGGFEAVHGTKIVDSIKDNFQLGNGNSVVLNSLPPCLVLGDGTI